MFVALHGQLNKSAEPQKADLFNDTLANPTRAPKGVRVGFVKAMSKTSQLISVAVLHKRTARAIHGYTVRRLRAVVVNIGNAVIIAIVVKLS